MTTRKAFEDHVNSLLEKSLADDEYALKSLACMALLVEGFSDDDPDGGVELPNVIFMDMYKKAA